jgi:MinD-like ATPase involved in chromosome partitioning or flagellar assembly
MTGSLEGLRTFAQRGSAARSRGSHPGLLVLAGGKGGVGTSTLAVLLAHAAAGEKLRVLLVDGTEGSGALHHLTGAGPDPVGLVQLARGEVDADAVVTPLAPGLDLVAGGTADPDDEVLLGPGHRASALLRASVHFSGYDVVLLDVGSRMAGIVASAGLQPGGLAVVTTSEPVALAGSYAVLKVARARLAHVAPQVVVTGRDAAGAVATHEIVRAASERFLGVDVALAGGVPDDPELAGRIREGRTLWQPDSPAAGAAQVLLGRLFPWMSAPLPDIRPHPAFSGS